MLSEVGWMATAEKRNFQNNVLDLIPSCYLPKKMTRIANSTNIGMKISCMLPTPCLSWLKGWLLHMPQCLSTSFISIRN